MTKNEKDLSPTADDAVEQLLAKAEPRPTPPPDVVAQAREAVFAEWTKVHRRRRQRWYGLAASIAIASVLWFSINNDTTLPAAAAVATVDKVSGDYYYRLDDGLLEQRPTQHSVQAGDTIVTETNAVLGLHWINGGSLRLDAETAVRFLPDDEIELLAGRVYFDSQSKSEQPVVLTIHTHLGDVRHLGTQFMTDVRSSDLLKVSVRQGRVAISGVYHDAEAAVGEQVIFHGDRRPLVTRLATHGAEWQWVQAAAPALDTNGKTFAQILKWVCDETGLRFRYETSAAKESAHTRLTGVAGEDPMALLRVSAVAAELQFTTEDGVIIVNQRSP